MVKVEFHCHTRYSKDSLVKIPDLLATCDKKHLQKLVITDHNTIQGGLEAQKLAPHLFVIGEEVMTLQGELLGIFLQEPVPASLSAMETIALLRQQGAFISVSHPFDAFREGHWGLADLLAILPLIDAIEVFNSRCINPQFNRCAKDFAIRNNLLGIVGSDAHCLGEVGQATLTLPDFDDAASLKLALPRAQSHVRLSGLWVHFYSRYASWRKKALRPIP